MTKFFLQRFKFLFWDLKNFFPSRFFIFFGHFYLPWNRPIKGSTKLWEMTSSWRYWYSNLMQISIQYFLNWLLQWVWIKIFEMNCRKLFTFAQKLKLSLNPFYLWFHLDLFFKIINVLWGGKCVVSGDLLWERFCCVLWEDVLWRKHVCFDEY